MLELNKRMITKRKKDVTLILTEETLKMNKNSHFPKLNTILLLERRTNNDTPTPNPAPNKPLY